MRMKLFLFLIPCLCFAAGDGHGSIKDLIAPGVNFVILMGFAIWKLRSPLKEHFVNLAKETKTSMDNAEAKSKIAKLKYEEQKKKLDQLESEIGKINKQNDDEIAKYENEFRANLKDKIARNISDSQKRLELEKQVALNQLGEDVLTKIISQCKSNINSNTGNKAKAEKTVIERL